MLKSWLKPERQNPGVYILILLLTCTITTAADSLGRKIMEKNNTLKKAVSLYNQSVMVIINGPIKEFKEFTLVTKTSGQQTRARFSFTKPVEMEIISWSQPGQPTRQWLKLGAGKFQEIASSDLKTSFIGSHFYNDDIADQYIDDYEYSYLGEETIKETPCYKVEARKNDGIRIYEKKIIYLRQSDYFIIQIDYYEKKGYTKTLTMDQIKTIDGIISAQKISMTKKESTNKTLVYLKDIKYNKPVSDKVFNP